MLDEAFAVGRTGNPVERVVEEARTAINRSTVAPRVAIDQAVLDSDARHAGRQVDRSHADVRHRDREPDGLRRHAGGLGPQRSTRRR